MTSIEFRIEWERTSILNLIAPTQVPLTLSNGSSVTSTSYGLKASFTIMRFTTIINT